MGFVFLFFWFSQFFFTKPINLSRKPKIQKKTNKTLGLIKKTKFLRFQTHPWIWVWFFVFFCVSYVFLVFFGFLWYFWFSRRVFWFYKNLRENKKQQKTKPISKGGSETLKKLFFWFFLIFFWFSLIFLVF